MSVKLLERQSQIIQQLRIIRSRSKNPKPNDRALRDSLNQDYDKVGTEFVKENLDSYYAGALIKGIVRSDNNYSKIGKILFDGLAEDIKATKMGKSISDMLDNKQKIQIGEILPDFAMADTLGKLVKLSDFHGKYVLVEFWASWCVPCRKENPNLVNAYQKYNQKGLEILSVSLDEEKKYWLKAINDDKLTWTHVSDLKAFEGELVKRFYIQSIPDNFLLDRNGKIIARNLRNEDLNKKLAEL